MEIFFSQLAIGASNGALYALLALGIVFIFRATDVANFAQGEMAMINTYVGWSISRPLSFAWIPLLGIDRHVSLLTWRPEVLGVPFHLGSVSDGTTRIGYFVVLLATVAIAFCTGALIERLIVRPSEKKNPLNAVIVTLGLFAVFNSVALWRYGPTPAAYPTPFKGDAIDFGLFHLGQHSAFALTVGVVMMVAIYLFFQHTKQGLGMRAAAMNPLAGQLMGINTGKMCTLGWGLAAALGAIAGMMVAPSVSGISPNLMTALLLYGFAAAVLGGLDSALGAVIGGLVVGISQSMVVQYIGSQWSEFIPFGLVIVILIAKPTGLFGAPVSKKV